MGEGALGAQDGAISELIQTEESWTLAIEEPREVPSVANDQTYEMDELVFHSGNPLVTLDKSIHPPEDLMGRRRSVIRVV